MAKALFDPNSNALNRLDYRAPEYTANTVDLYVNLDDTQTTVRSTVEYQPNPDAPDSESGPLILNAEGTEIGKGMKINSIKVNGQPLDRKDFLITHEHVIIKRPPQGKFTVEIENEIDPSNNSLLEGLYKTDNFLVTQCEAHGFRRITPMLDRPDVLATYTTTLEADKKKLPIILSNGNGDPAQTEDLGNGRHRMTWVDPHPKPSYLFAIASGDFAVLEDKYVTKSGKEVTLRIFVEPGFEDKVTWAMESIKRSMKWDEEAYGREYDLDVFHVVAVNKFNAGAMENKGLNIFNVSLLVGDPDTSTDAELVNIEAVIGHEYFHNWTGDRVTLRDWFELTLKEGLTVLRDRQFTADMHSTAIKTLDDAMAMKAGQFVEDASPKSHPIRPDIVQEFDNIYSGTVYEKGSHVLGMLHTMMGPTTWRAATDEYFDRFDGKAATCDDFVDVMEEVSGLDLTQFRQWYRQSGTPELEYDGVYDAATKTYKLTVRQNTPATHDQPASEKQPLHIPIRMGLIDKNSGNDVPLTLKGEDADNESGLTTRVLHLTEAEQTFEFTGVEADVVPSLLRGFSAPVKINTVPSDEELLFRMAHDNDPYNKHEAGQQLMLKQLLSLINSEKTTLDQAFIDAFGNNLRHATTGDMEFASMMLSPPPYSLLAQEMEVIDPIAITEAVKTMRETLFNTFKDDFAKLYKMTTTPANEKYDLSEKQVGRRALHNMALGYLSVDKANIGVVAKKQFDQATNMTERLAALNVLVNTKSPQAEEAKNAFYQKYKDNQNVVDKYLRLIGAPNAEDTLDRVKAEMQNEAFAGHRTSAGRTSDGLTNPNKVRALIGRFVAGNPAQFHRRDGKGYEFLGDVIEQLNDINPRMGAGLITPLMQWRRYDEPRQKQMKAQLERIAKLPNLAPGLQELTRLALGDAPEDRAEEKPVQQPAANSAPKAS